MYDSGDLLYTLLLGGSDLLAIASLQALTTWKILARSKLRGVIISSRYSSFEHSLELWSWAKAQELVE
jgi:hypothetical protein